MLFTFTKDSTIRTKFIGIQNHSLYNNNGRFPQEPSVLPPRPRRRKVRRQPLPFDLRSPRRDNPYRLCRRLRQRCAPSSPPPSPFPILIPTGTFLGTRWNRHQSHPLIPSHHWARSLWNRARNRPQRLLPQKRRPRGHRARLSLPPL